MAESIQAGGHHGEEEERERWHERGRRGIHGDRDDRGDIADDDERREDGREGVARQDAADAIVDVAAADLLGHAVDDPGAEAGQALGELRHARALRARARRDS